MRRLKEYSSLIRKNLRPYDILARYGGEEFVILFLHATKKDAYEIVRRLKDKVQTSVFEFGGNSIRFTFSCGVSDFSDFPPEYHFTPDALLGIADQRLYAAKHNGRNRVEYQ